MTGSLRRFVADFSRYAGGLGVLSALCVGLASLLDGLGIMLLVPIAALVLDSGGQHGFLHSLAAQIFMIVGAKTRFARLAAMLCVFAVLMALRGIVIIRRDVLLMRLQIGFVEAKRVSVTTRLAKTRWDIVARLRHARIANLMGSDMAAMSGAIHYLIQGAVALTMLVSQAVLAFLLSPAMAAIGVALLMAGTAASVLLLRRANVLGRFIAGTNLYLLNSSLQFLGGVKLAVSQNLQDSFLREYQNALADISERQMDFTRQQTHNRAMATTLTGVAGGVVMLVGFGMMNLSPAFLLPLLYVMARMNGPALMIQQCLQQLARSLPAYDNILELENELGAGGIEPAPGRPAEIPAGAIRFRKVSFSHGDDAARPIFHDLDLVIAPGSFVGLCGSSGAGKTSFADLLVGLYPPHAGEISCGGVSLTGPALDGWRNRLSYVSQDPFLFHDTIRRNLAWAAPDASEADMWEALALAGADTLVRRLPEGLETLAGERGTLMSGGERQRLALARALLRRPCLLVLDEATNAIDIAGEAELLFRLRSLQPRPTILLIAHRQESLAHCDRVLTLDQGRFIDRPDAAPP